MAVSLSISNAGDGTGTATITGSGGSDTNSLYQAAMSFSPGTLSFGLEGSRTGDGTIPLSGSGMWLWLLESVAAGNVKTNVVVYQPITGSEATSVLYRILTTVQTNIQALSLSGISSANVVIKWLPRAYDATTDPVPAIIVSPASMPEKVRTDTNNTDHVDYPILISMIDRNNADFDDQIARDTLWRQRIVRAFRQQPITGIAEAVNVSIEPRPIIDPGWFDKNYFHSSVLLRVLCREQRGVS